MALPATWYDGAGSRGRAVRLGCPAPGTLRVVSVRMNYWPDAAHASAVLEDPLLAYVSRYALGRDYHKIIRQKLKQLADKITAIQGEFGFRPFVDSAHVLV